MLATALIGASLTLLLSIYFFYRVLKSPSPVRILSLGVAVGMTLAAKFTGVFVIPIIVIISLLDLWNRKRTYSTSQGGATPRQLATAIATISAIGIFFIWAIYRFRFAARPANLALDPATNQYPLGQITEEHFDQTFDLNVRWNPVHGSESIARCFNDGGSIPDDRANAGSERFSWFRCLYAASKLALRSGTYLAQ